MASPLPSPLDPAPSPELEQLGIDVIRGLAIDAPRAAKSGHPGTAMALAPLAHVLFTRVMRHNPADPDWPDRDRFVLSNGHASILLYSMLYLTGYGLTWRTCASSGPGAAARPAIPSSTTPRGWRSPPGPLGQGFANGVGMGIAERWLRSHFSPELCDHHTYVIAGDGCLEEGISHEAASLAGHLQLGRLVYVYDDNHITIDGPTELSLDDDPGERFRAYGWHVDEIGEAANDVDALEAALRAGPGRGGPTVAHRPAQPHRLPGPPPDRHGQGPRRPVRGRRGPADQGDPRSPHRPDVLGARRGRGDVPDDHPAGPGHDGRVGGAPGRLGR